MPRDTSYALSNHRERFRRNGRLTIIRPRRQTGDQKGRIIRLFRRSPSPGGGKTDRGVVRQARPRRDRVPGGRGEEEQPGAEAYGSDIPGGVAGISHLRAGTTVAQRDQSSTTDASAPSKKLKRSRDKQEVRQARRGETNAQRKSCKTNGGRACSSSSPNAVD